MSGQLTFDLDAAPGYLRADFFASPANALALEAVGRWRTWPSGVMLVVGAEGSGKTHLAHVWAEEAGAVLVSGHSLDVGVLGGGAGLAVDDADGVAGDPGAETALFHLYNMVVQGGGRLLLTARAPLRDWGLTLPDLASRIAAADVCRLEMPDDALLAAVLVKLFSDRQIAVPPNVVAYLVSRMERSVAAAGLLVARLDQLALATRRPITRNLAVELLDSAGDE